MGFFDMGNIIVFPTGLLCQENCFISIKGRDKDKAAEHFQFFAMISNTFKELIQQNDGQMMYLNTEARDY